jgi:Transcription factor WhiB
MSGGWAARGLCAQPGADPELWFAGRDNLAAVRAAKQACAGCPVRGECLAAALVIRPQSGIWAGYSTEELRQMPPGPRNCEVCHVPFVSSGPGRRTKYCGPACQHAAHRAQQAAYEQRQKRLRQGRMTNTGRRGVVTTATAQRARTNLAGRNPQ